MTPDRWQRLKVLFDDALKLSPSQRGEFLAKECSQDVALREEIESLLASYDSAPEFIEQPAAHKLASQILNDRQPINIPPVVQTDRRRSTRFWLLMLVAAFEVALFVFAGVMIYRYLLVDRPMGWQAAEGANGWVVSVVTADGPAAGRLRVGDQLVSLNNDTRVSRIGPRLKSRSIPPETSYSLTIRRNSIEQTYPLQRPAQQRSLQNVGYVLSVLFTSLLFFVVGLWVAISKPAQRVAQIFALAWFGSAQVLLARALDPIRIYFDSNEIFGNLLITGIDPFHIALTFHVFYLFPSGELRGRLWTSLKYIFYVWGAGLAIAWLGIRWPWLGNDETLTTAHFNTYYLGAGLLKVHLIFLVVCSIAGCVVLVRNYRLLKEPDQQRRIKWVIYALLAAVLPVTGFFLVIAVGVGSGRLFLTSNSMPLQAWWWFSLVAIGIVPVTFGYAILTRRVSDVHIVVRRGIQYVLAKNSLRAILALPLLGLVYIVVSQRNLSIGAILSQNPVLILLIVVGALGLAFRRQLSRGIDRRFFREAYNQEQILLRLIDGIKSKDSLAAISQLVNDEIDAALHPQRIQLFFQRSPGTELRPGVTSDVSLPAHFRLLRFMEDHGGAVDFPFPPKNNLPTAEKHWLAATDASLIVPMLGNEGRLTGLLILGEKKSEEPYTTTDRRLLEAIASQIAVICENIWLREQITSTASAAENIHSEKYSLERLIGEGGMGRVYLARDRQLDRPVALKFLPDELASDQKRLSRFFQEAKAASALNHPNIITVYEVGKLGDQHFIATEFVTGVTLRQRIKESELTLAQVLDIATQIGSALAEAHAAGIIHRDIKPENIMIRPDGYVKVLDFGLAKLSVRAVEKVSLTDAGMVMGTIRYMSPEQSRGLSIDGRADVWSLGVVIYEMLTGSVPFQGETLSDVLAAILTSEPRPIDGAPEEMKIILDRALRKNAAERYQSIREMLMDLRNLMTKSLH